MATLRNKQKLAAVTTETQEEHPRNGKLRNTSVPRITEEYIRQVSEEIAGRVTKKLSRDLSRTEFRILGALSKLDQFLQNPQIRTHSGTVRGTFRNANVENQEPNEDRSKDDPRPEVGPSVCQPVIQLTQTQTRFLTTGGLLRCIPPADYFSVEAVAAASCLLIDVMFCESTMHNVHNLEI